MISHNVKPGMNLYGILMSEEQELTLKVLLTAIHALGLLNRIITAQWEGMVDVGSARYEVRTSEIGIILTIFS